MKEQKSFEDLAKTLQSFSLGDRDINYMKEEIVAWIKDGSLNKELEELGYIKKIEIDRADNDGRLLA